MKRFYLAAVAATLTALPSLALHPGAFAKRSLLSEGRWVKIGVEQSGIYEISHEALRQMGFENPENVGLFGNGGQQQGLNFVNAIGTLTLHDDMVPVGVWHYGDKMYFYAQGVEDISFKVQKSNPLLGYYNRNSLNIYSNKGYYFLSDSQKPKLITAETNKPTSSHKEIAEAVSFVYHEKDLFHNNSSSGQLFWGEYINAGGGNRLSWDVDLSEAIDNSTGWMVADIYTDKTEDLSLSYGLENCGKTIDFMSTSYASSNFRPQSPSSGEVGVKNGIQKLYVQVAGDKAPTVSNLDYWLLSYKTRIPTLNKAQGVSQARFATPGISRNEKIFFNIPEGGNYAVFNITERENPKVITGESAQGTTSFALTASTSYTDLIVFDTSRPQMQISGWGDSYSPIANQNLHAYGEEGADLLIITIPKFREYAERIAELHRRKEGLKVVVATTEECYNEFSGGVPDPMAYRSLAKMLYMGKTPLKNVLLFGPIYSDFRGVSVEKDPLEGIIGFQNTAVSIERGAANINDFIGMMADFLTTDYLEKEEVNLGIGLLPVRFPSEAEIAIKKIEHHLDETHFAYFLNKSLNVGGTLDKNQHARQAKDIGIWISKYDSHATISTPLIIDAYGNKAAREKMMEEINGGTTFMMYFGHGAEGYLGKDYQFFTNTEANRMTNTTLPVTFFAGCLLSNTDRGRRGLGETMVTATPHGSLASILALRETWSGQNLDFFHSLFRLIFLEEDKDSAKRRSTPLTLGGLMAAVKTSSIYNNELSYNLIGDPALVIPVVNRQVVVDASTLPKAIAGNDFEISGYVADANGEVDESYNGECVGRLMEPIVTLESHNVVTSSMPDELDKEPLYIDYAQTQLSMGVAEVKDGRFTIKLHVPGDASKFASKVGRLHLATYDPTQRIGGGSLEYLDYDVVAEGETTLEEGDNVAPVIESMSYDGADNMVKVTASDNYALSLSCNPLNKAMKVWLDGKEFTSGSEFTVFLGDDNRSMSRKISVGNINYGEHCMRVRVSDAAGNIAEQEITFTYAPNVGTYTLQLEENDIEKGLTFGFLGEYPVKGTLYITDAEGKTLHSTGFTGNKIHWDRILSNGERLGAGHYKAYVIEHGNTLGNSHTQTIDIPLI
ncbi:MAG: C25 family cysteine peptidase [Muribaculaceae bacterium]|nr:C25 family cysteine peptidase [Muribaculaceae bacterium]